MTTSISIDTKSMLHSDPLRAPHRGNLRVGVGGGSWLSNLRVTQTWVWVWVGPIPVGNLNVGNPNVTLSPNPCLSLSLSLSLSQTLTTTIIAPLA